MKVPFFDLGVLARSEATELHACLDEVLATGYFVGGPITARFEEEFAAFIGTAQAVGVANGLDAIRLILEAYDIGPGDEVIVPAFTYYATWLGVTQTGATPVPVDVLGDTANIDPAAIEAAITPNTRAVIAVHLFGQGADLAAIRAITDRHDLLLFEDAAQSHGAMSSAGLTGSVGHAAAFSFYPTKNLGALGDSGAVTTSDDAVAAHIRSRRSYGQGSSKYDHVDTGWNSRLDPLQAAFLSLHLRKLEGWTLRRREIAQRYLAALSNPAAHVVGPVDTTQSVWHHFVLKAANREKLQGFLEEQGVSSDAHYPYSVNNLAPMRALMTADSLLKKFPVSEQLANSVVSLPMGPWMTDDQVEQVTRALQNIPDGLLG
ncbi:MAG: DegT/DnrJ/EryC1/StrS family aminotransferase [Actinomycetales bacterium]|nr:DegT/DnrJ/EryC1/StrS family aminotransferase [Actinomycetales bacterium]